MNSTFRRLGPSELLPRYIFAEPLFAGRTVLEIGAVASTGGLSAQFLAARGARSVLACDGDLGAVEAALKVFSGPNLRYRAELFDDLKTGSFELVLVADLAECVRRPELLREVRRLLSDRGFLLGGLRNPAGLSLSQLVQPEGGEKAVTYGQLIQVLATCFAHLKIATQGPLLGYQLAFEQGQGLRVDGRLASPAEAAYFVAIAGHQPCPLFEPSWVQLPPEALAYTASRIAELSGATAHLSELSRALDEERARARRLEQEVSIAAQGLASIEVEAQLAADRAAEQERRVAEKAANARTLEEELGEAKGALAKIRNELAAERSQSQEARQAASAAQAAAASAAAELAQLRKGEESSAAERRNLRDERQRLASEVERLEGERAHLRQKLEAAQLEREELRRAANELATAVADRESKLETLQRRLAVQDAEIASLRRSLPRSSMQVQQIYERATAELIALKAELFRRSESRPAQTGEVDPENG